MSITSSSGSHYMSNASIMAWMEEKTERLYEQMGTAMDQSNSRADAEDALNDVKTKIDALKASGADAAPLSGEIKDIIARYDAEFPEVRQALQPIADELDKKAADIQLKAQDQWTAPNANRVPGTRSGSMATPTPAQNQNTRKSEPVASKQSDDKVDKVPELPKLTISSDDAERWSNQIKNKVDALGKQDQLGMVHLQDLNGQLNRAKDVASALMASADKAADNIVSHIG